MAKSIQLHHVSFIEGRIEILTKEIQQSRAKTYGLQMQLRTQKELLRKLKRNKG